MTQQLITETRTALEATPIEGQPGRLLVGIISPGQGSSGFYSQDVLEAAATDKVFPKGTHMYFDHPTESDKVERPERSVKDLAAVLESDARWDGSQLVGEASIVGPYRELLTDPTFTGAIGVSIRASAEVDETTEGTIITRLVEGKSADFVTHAGRGGSILDVLESARPSVVNEKAIARGVTEATVNDKREALGNLIREEYATDKTWAWLRDFDDDVAYFDIESGNDAGTWSQGYSTGAEDMPNALVGDRTEVRASTTYVPVTPAGQLNTEESSGGHMGTTQIEESALTELREKAGRAETAESERDAATARAEKAEATLAEVEATKSADEHARKRVLEANSALPATTVDRIVKEALREVPLNDKHELDEAKFDKVVDDAKTAEEAYLAGLAEQAGAGSITGFGVQSSDDGTVSEADFDAAFNKAKEA